MQQGASSVTVSIKVLSHNARFLLRRAGVRSWIAVIVGVLCLVLYLTKKPERIPDSVREYRPVAPVEKGFCVDGDPGCKDGKTMPLIVHLDLKGSPPTLSYLRQFLPFVKTLGATGLLIEYEDTFPYAGDLAVLRSAIFSYSPDEVRELVKLAHDLGLSVIPLVQTFGHMEFVLKHDNFRSLREEPGNDWSVCPQNKGSMDLIGKMIDQVMSLHPHSKHVHIGGDEVVNMGHCPDCFKLVQSYGREELFRRHMLVVMKHVVTHWDGVRCLFWDDMIRRWDLEKLKALAAFGDPMAWSYVDNAERLISPNVLRNFAAAFPKVWVASSFKGSGGKDIDWVPVRHHVNNHHSWNRLLQKGLPSVDSVGGFVLTGWSRYMHHFPLCELLPAGIPSLALCLAVAASHEQDALSTAQIARISSTLGFSNNLPMRNEPHLQDEITGLRFPGHEVYEIVYRQSILLQEMQQVKQVFNGHDRAKFAAKLSAKAVKLVEDAEVALGHVYPPPIVREWIKAKLSPVLAWAQQHA